MGDDSSSNPNGAARKPLLEVQTDIKDEHLSQSWCPSCCLFPVISPSGNNNSRLHGTLLKDLPWIGAVFVTFAVLMSILFGIMLRNYGEDAPVVNVNLGQFNMIAALMLLTWFGWGYAVSSRFFYGSAINYVDVLNLGTPPIADPSRRERYLSPLGVARLTATIALMQGVSLGIGITLWRNRHFHASAAVVLLVLFLHLCFLFVPRGFERDSRLALRTTLLRCFAAPWCHVLFIDNVVGDVLTSAQGNALISFARWCDLEFYLTFIRN